MGKRRPSGDGMVRKRPDGRWEGRIVVGHKKNGDSIFRYLSAGTQKELMKQLHHSIEEYRGVDLSEDSKMPRGQWRAKPARACDLLALACKDAKAPRRNRNPSRRFMILGP